MTTDVNPFVQELAEELEPVVESAVDEWHFSLAVADETLVQAVSLAVANHLIGDLR